MPKKIAFIGCSYSAYYQDTSVFHWTTQLVSRYPQHTYKTFAKGGQGPDYFRLCILEAKEWGADAIFVNTTYDGRHCVLVDAPSNEDHTPDYVWGQSEIHKNFYYSWLNDLNATWVSGGKPALSVKSSTKKLLNEFNLHVAASNTSKRYNHKWYKNLSKLYNFEKIWVLDFRKDPPFILEHNSTNVWEVLKNYVPENSLDQRIFAKHGICISDTDDHWTTKGHTLVLNSYVLNEDVKNYLTQS